MEFMLVDNGSRRPEATLNLRRVASELTDATATPVAAVSLLHSHKIDAARLDGQPAEVFEPFLRRRLSDGERHFVVLPLFFGHSRALSEFVPETREALSAEFGPFEVRVARVLCPLPDGEARLVEILLDNLHQVSPEPGAKGTRVIVVDHGSPIPEVTAVRSHLANAMRARLGSGVELREAVMERREGPEYDFNGPLLETVLRQLAADDPARPVVLSMLFLSPGRHAGPGGDIEQICASVRAEYPELDIAISPLVAEHPGLVDILAERLREASKT